MGTESVFQTNQLSMNQRVSCTMNFNRRRSGGVTKKRLSLSRGKVGSSRSSANKSFSTENNCIKVIVRARPLNERETGKGKKLISVVDEHLLIFDPPEEEEGFFFQGQEQLFRDLNKKVNKNVNFLFDRVFDGTSSNEEVFNESVQPIMDNLLSGFNCSVFAYGATGAGKTFTMLGAPSIPGITYFIVQNIFQRMEEMTDKICDLNIAYLEVYNETVKDLLTASPPLMLRDDSKGVTVAGLSYQKPSSAEHLLELLHYGNRNRTQHPTDANAESSRSHAVFQIYLKIKDRVGGLSENVQLSKMSLIDLAGSERACVVAKRGMARQREGANINQSLLALGTCINALATKNGKAQHIPYRNSKLTRILKDSLGGNCKTVMIAAVSPSSLTYEDTYNTLRYAERAKKITVTLKKNTTQVDAHLSGYKEIVTNLQSQLDKLKEENEVMKKENEIIKTERETLKRRIEDLNEIHAKRPRLDELQGQISSQSLDPVWKTNVDCLCEQIMKYKKNILDLESQLQSVKAHQFWRQFSHNRIAALTVDHKKITRSLNKLDTLMKSMQAKTERFTNEKGKNQELYKQKMTILESLYETDNCELKRTYIEKNLSKMETFSLHSHLSHTIELSTSNLKQTCEAWKFSEESMKQVRKLQSILKGHGFLTADLVAKYDDLLKQAECGREVAWADNPPVPSDLHQEFLQHLLLPSSGFLAPLPLSGQDAEDVPLATYCSNNTGVKEESSLQIPSTPLSSRQSYCDTLMSPGISSQISPIFSKERSNLKRASPHPKNLAKLNTQELLDLIKNDPEPVRRSLEETFVSSPKASTSNLPSVHWRGSIEKTDLHNLTFSPMTHSDYNRPCTFMVSTPSTDRINLPRTSSFAIPQEPHSTGNNCTNLEMIPAVSSCGCQQMQIRECCIHEAVPLYSGSCVSTTTGSNILVAQQGASCMLPPNPVVYSATQPRRIPSPRQQPQQVGSEMPSVRNKTVFQRNAKSRLEPQMMEGPLDSTHLVSSTSGPFQGPTAHRYRTSKENVDPYRNLKKTTSAYQRRTATPMNRKVKTIPVFKTGKY